MSRILDTQLQEEATPFEVLAEPWEMVGKDIFMINNKNLLLL